MWRLLLAALLLSSCGENAISRPDATSVPAAAGHDRGQPAPAPVAAPLVVFLGDSLTAGYGLDEEEAFPARLAELLGDRGQPIRLVNAGVSGDTSAGGLRRVDWVLQQQPDVLVVGLGANDGLRGQPLDGIEQNLRQILRRALDRGSRVLLLGMRVPPSLGASYAEGFAAIFPRLAEELRVPLMPFLLEEVGGRPELNLPDGIHPTAEGHQLVATSVLPYLLPLVEADHG